MQFVSKQALDGSATRRKRTVFGLAAFVGGSALAIWQFGLPLSTDVVFLWLMCALLALSLSDLGRWGRGVIIDWLPLGGILLFYDSSHGLSKLLGTPTHAHLQMDFDRWLFGTAFVARPLQHWLGQG